MLARRTPGFTGADLANLLNEAALLAARRRLSHVGMPECEDAIDRVIAGPERKTRVLTEHEKSVIAYHEAGHALVGHVLPGTDPIHKVSIIARGRALGWTLALPTEDRVLRTRSELRDELTMLLGGRSAEELVFGDPTTGAQNDIEKATQIARAMVTEWGMSDHLGPRQLGAPPDAVPSHPGASPTSDHGDELSSQIDDEVRTLIDVAHAEAQEILVAHRATLDRLAAALVERETLEAEELTEVFEGISHVTHRPPSPARPRAITPVAVEAEEPVRELAGASAAVRATAGRRTLRSRLAGWLEPGTPTP